MEKVEKAIEAAKLNKDDEAIDRLKIIEEEMIAHLEALDFLAFRVNCYLKQLWMQTDDYKKLYNLQNN